MSVQVIRWGGFCALIVIQNEYSTLSPMSRYLSHLIKWCNETREDQRNRRKPRIIC